MSRRRTKKLITIVVGIFSLLVAYNQQNTLKPVVKVAEQNQPGLYTVVEFVDGDTLAVDMNGKKEKVRLIGVDTPETHDPRKSVQCFGQAASNFTKQFIGSNKVRLESDPQNTNRDRYNRLLRYVYLPDGRMVNAELLKQGYAFAYTFFPFSKMDEFRDYEQSARTNNLGLWGQCSQTTEPNGQVHTDAL